MRIYILSLIALVSFSFSCNDAAKEAGANATENAVQLTEAEKEKMYKEAEERARKKIQNGADENSLNLVAGKWSKVNSLPCTDGYPNLLNLGADGIFSTDDKVSNGLKWTNGSYNLKNQDEIIFINEAEETNSYQFKHFPKMAMITIHLSSDCTLVYKKNL